MKLTCIFFVCILHRYILTNVHVSFFRAAELVLYVTALDMKALLIGSCDSDAAVCAVFPLKGVFMFSPFLHVSFKCFDFFLHLCMFGTIVILIWP